MGPADGVEWTDGVRPNETYHFHRLIREFILPLQGLLEMEVAGESIFLSAHQMLVFEPENGGSIQTPHKCKSIWLEGHDSYRHLSINFPFILNDKVDVI